ncbi:hypothetical protein LOC68_06780 [Blastopirellula sp. JC732]|uniref:Uncharacterized protein n=1 Tax=Blastopirellula sediminis TaxID=2894196 RepID=A0A9X1SIJ1_9BACT|nr:hypothetical protein [Blastopirellula sediminis]MCC9609129.1 hypothetical protein [Blastopirellula sediminis]MCC9628094.1 hypothetical protein [Blastopirellula sediminis]
MSGDLFFGVMERLTPQLRAGDPSGCEVGAIEALLALPATPFHIAADLNISNDPAEVAAHFDRFYRLESLRLDIGAVYTEMNGFDINPDRWYCDVFAYISDGGIEDWDWLSNWQSEYFYDCTITGLEPLQNVYASKAFRDPANNDASYLSSIVVVTKFQRFMQRCAAEMVDLRVPLYITAHDFDYIARIVPAGK